MGPGGKPATAMKPCRLAADAPHKLTGSAISRAAPVHFSIDGLKVSGFAGDSVLSALMADGFAAFGTHLGHPLGLDGQSPFYVGVVQGQHRVALPAAQVPIANGLALRSGGRIRRPKNWRLAWGKKPPAYGSLGQPVAAPFNHSQACPLRQISADIAIVGGGVAGLAAAVFAARSGQRTVLVERETGLGGISEYFARVEGEPDPAETVNALMAAVGRLDNLQILTGATIDEVSKGRVSGLAVNCKNPVAPVLERLDIAVERIVLATGALERLPLFSGNRLAGVVPSIFAWRLAARFGVWLGKSARFFTATNATYRLAMLATDAGIGVQRIADTRLDPQSRLIAFAKAYGIRMGFGTGIRSVWRDENGGGQLCVETGTVTDARVNDVDISATDTLIVGCGLQPNVRLWALAGGEVCWEGAQGRIVAGHGPHWLAVAGAANGKKTLPGVIGDAEGAVMTLLGDGQAPVEETEIDPIYESADGPLPASVPVPGDGTPGYFDSGRALALLPQIREKRRFMDRLLWQHDSNGAGGGETRFQPPTIVEVAARAAIGNLAPEEVQMVTTERVIEVRNLNELANDDGARAPRTNRTGVDKQPDTGLPTYLFNRFGRTPVRVRVVADDGRRMEPGCLVFANSEERNPDRAIGVVIGELDGAAIGVFSASQSLEANVSVADVGGRSAASLMELPQ
jgi:NADPH-dependent 2,4-dienoyl-CoA reductase/sulfur reductase-like enzyme